MSRLRLSFKIPLIVVAVAVIASLAVGHTAIYSSKQTLIASAKNNLQEALSLRKTTIGIYLKSIQEDLAYVSGSNQTKNAIKEFKREWKLAEAKKLKKLQTEGSEGINSNKNRVRSRKHDEHHAAFWQLLKVRGYNDIFLFDMQGNIIYSATDDLKYNDFRNTNLAEAFRASARSTAVEGDQFFFDFQPSATNSHDLAGFLSTPVFEKAQKIGVIVYQLPINSINIAMATYQESGKTGKTYIVGSDNLMRSNSRFSQDNITLSTKAEGIIIKKGLAGISGVEFAQDYRGEDVLSAFAPLPFMGTNWVIVTDISKQEVLEPISKVEEEILHKSLIAILVLAILAFIFSKCISRPLATVNKALNDIAEGNSDIDIKHTARNDEIGDFAKSALKLKESIIENARLAEEQREIEKTAQLKEAREKKEAYIEIVRKFEEKVKIITSSLAKASAQLAITSQAMSATIENSSKKTSAAIQDAERTNDNIKSISSATEAMLDSVNKISTQMQKSSLRLNESSNKAQATDERARTLEAATGKVRDAVRSISNISERINLLGLNATIEAARNEEGNNSFTVVAGEMRKFAVQAQATLSEADNLINGLTNSTEEIVNSIAEIKTAISSASESSAEIADATEEQSAATLSVSQSIHKASQNAADMSLSLLSVSRHSDETSQSASSVFTAAEQLSKQAEELNAQVQEILKDITVE